MIHRCSFRTFARLAVVSVVSMMALAACDGDLDPAWQLDHERIIAVRATPPAILAGETSTIDALIGRKGDKTSVASPEAAVVVSPASLADTLALRGDAWVVTAPSAERLAAVRIELGLAVDAPVPLQIGVSYENQAMLPADMSGDLFAIKAVTLGRTAANPVLVDRVVINDQPAAVAEPDDDELVVGKLVNVPLSIDANDVDYDVSWLTSCGTMHDFDLPNAYLKVEDDDPTEGELAVVLRDAAGGVAWAVWPIRAE